jgi:hypothetical protein
MEGWTGWKGRRWPLLFACNSADDEIEQEGGGWYNVQEAFKACDFARSLMHSGLIEQQDICIMSSFRAQVNLLRHNPKNLTSCMESTSGRWRPSKV